jgi:tetratricopeptide (TPR) repeat protein
MRCKLAYICALSAFVSVSARAQGLKPSDSIPQLEAAVGRDSNDAQLHYRLGIAYWSRKRYDEAERSLLTAVAIERRFADAYLALGYLPYARRRQLMKEEAQGNVPAEWRDSVLLSQRLRRRAFLTNPLVDLKIMGAFVPVRSGFLADLTDPFSAFVRGNYAMAYLTFDRWIGDQPRDSIPSGLLWFHGLSAGHIALYDTAASDFQRLLDRSLKAEQSDTLSPIPLGTNDFR